MKKIFLIIFLMISLTVSAKEKEDVKCKDVKNMTVIQIYDEISRLRKRVNELENLKKHFYNFRERVYKGVPLDFLSKVTLEDFNFKKYEKEENENTK